MPGSLTDALERALGHFNGKGGFNRGTAVGAGYSKSELKAMGALKDANGSYIWAQADPNDKYSFYKSYLIEQSSQKQFPLNQKLDKAGKIVDITSNTVVTTIAKGFQYANKAAPSTMYAAGALKMSRAGAFLEYTGMVITAAQAFTDKNGWQWKHTIDIGMGLASMQGEAGAYIGIGWFISNLVSLSINNKSTSENIQIYFQGDK